jgi:hypothetical protein
MSRLISPIVVPLVYVVITSINCWSTFAGDPPQKIEGAGVAVQDAGTPPAAATESSKAAARPSSSPKTSASTTESVPLSAQPGTDIDGDPLPPGVVARLGTKRFRPWRAPIALSFLPDGKTLALTTTDGWQQHWNATTGRLLREKRLSDHEISAATVAAKITAERCSSTRTLTINLVRMDQV